MFKLKRKWHKTAVPLTQKAMIANMMKIAILLIMVIFVVLVIGSLINGQKPDMQGTLPPDLPPVFPSNSQATSSATVKLYFRYSDSDALAAQSREIEFSPDERKEAAVLRELIKGPAAGSPALESTIHPQTGVVGVKDAGDTLIVTLSPDFLRLPGALPDDWAWDIALRAEVFLKKRLATISIVNTLTGMGEYSDVLILIDTDGTRTGKRVSRAQMGFEDDPSPRTPFEPMAYQGDAVLSAANTAERILQALIERNYAGLYKYIGLRDKDNIIKPSVDKVSEELMKYAALQRFEVLGETISADGKSAVVRANLTRESLEGGSMQSNSVPITLRTENEIWVISYSDLLKLASRGGTI